MNQIPQGRVRKKSQAGLWLVAVAVVAACGLCGYVGLNGQRWLSPIKAAAVVPSATPTQPPANPTSAPSQPPTLTLIPTPTSTSTPSPTPTETPTPTPIFQDIQEADKQAIEAVWKAGIITECGTDPLRFCPEDLFLRGPYIRSLDVAYEGTKEVPAYVGSFRDVVIVDPPKNDTPEKKLQREQAYKLAAYGEQAVRLGFWSKPYWCSLGKQYLCPDYNLKVGLAAAWIEDVRLLKASNSTSSDFGGANLFVCNLGAPPMSLWPHLWPQRPCVGYCGDNLCNEGCGERCSNCEQDCGRCPSNPPPAPPPEQPTAPPGPEPAPAEQPRQHYVEPDLPIPTATPSCPTGFEAKCVLTRRVAAWLFAQGFNLLPSPTPSP